MFLFGVKYDHKESNICTLAVLSATNRGAYSKILVFYYVVNADFSFCKKYNVSLSIEFCIAHGTFLFVD